MSIFKKILLSLTENIKPKEIKEAAPAKNALEPLSENNFNNQSGNYRNYNLNPTELLMLDQANGKKLADRSFPLFWEYQYNSNPAKIVDSLLKKELLFLDDSYRFQLENMTNEELKRILKSYELKVSGRKKELIARVIENVNEYELSKFCTNVHLRLTDKGQNILDENSHIPYFHKSMIADIDIFEAQEVKMKHNSFTNHEIGIHLLTKKVANHLRNGDYGLFTNCLRGLYKITLEKKDYLESIKHLFFIVYLDLSGLHNNYDKEMIPYMIDSYFPYQKSLAKIPPGIVKDVVKIKSTLGMSDAELLILFKQTVPSLKVPFHLFGIEESAKILMAEMNYDINQLEDIYLTAEKRLSKIKKTPWWRE